MHPRVDSPLINVRNDQLYRSPPTSTSEIRTADDALSRANADSPGGTVVGETPEVTLANIEASRELAIREAVPGDVFQVNQAYDELAVQFTSGPAPMEAGGDGEIPEVTEAPDQEKIDTALEEVEDILQRAKDEDDDYQTRVILRELESTLKDLTPEEIEAVFESLGAEDTRELGEQLSSVWGGGINASVPLGFNDIYESLATGLSPQRLTSLTIGLRHGGADAATTYLGKLVGEAGGERALEYIDYLATWGPAEDHLGSPDQYAGAIAAVMAQLEGPELNQAVAALDQTQLEAVMRTGVETYTRTYGTTLTVAILKAATGSEDAAASNPHAQARLFAAAGVTLEHILGEDNYSAEISSTTRAMAQLLHSSPNEILTELRPTEANSTPGSSGVDNAGRALVAMNTVLLGDYTNYRKSDSEQQMVGEIMAAISSHGAEQGIPDDQIAANLGFFTGSAFNALENMNIDARDSGDTVLVNIMIGLVGEIPYPGAAVSQAVITEVRDHIGQNRLNEAQEDNQQLANVFLDLALEHVPHTDDASDANTEKFNEYFSYTRSTQLDR